MQTRREALLAIYRGEPADFIPAKEKTIFGAIMPGDRYFGGVEGEDMWGVRWTNLGPDPGLDGSTVTPGSKKLSSISEWKNEITFPDIDSMPLAAIWKDSIETAKSLREEMVIQGMLLSGPWERMNELLGMEDALCAFYEDPDAVHEFLGAMCEYKIKCIDKLCEFIDPDLFHIHDDWGTGNNLFFSPEMWREFIKPIVKRITDHIHSKGKLYEHHSCGHITAIVPDLVEIGVDALQPLNVCNDLEYIYREFGDKITFAGCIDNQRIDRDDSTEEEIRAEVRRAMDTYAPKGRFIPDFVFTNARVRDIFVDEVDRYGKIIYNR